MEMIELLMFPTIIDKHSSAIVHQSLQVSWEYSDYYRGSLNGAHIGGNQTIQMYGNFAGFPLYNV